MSTVTLYPSGPPTGVDLGEAGAVVTNYGAGTVSYSDVAEPFVAEGTIAASATATLSGTQFFRAATGAVLGIAALDASLGSLEAIRAQLLAVEGDQIELAAGQVAILAEGPTTPARWAEPGDPDDRLALQRMIDAIARAPNGEGRLIDSYDISDELVIAGPVNLQGDLTRYTAINLTDPSKNAIQLSRDIDPSEQGFTRGVVLKGFRVNGQTSPSGRTSVGVNADDGVSTYQGQFLDIDLQITGFDVGFRSYHWDNSDVAIFFEDCRVGGWIGDGGDGNANSMRLNIGGTRCSETILRLGDGGYVLLDRDMISSAQMLDLLSGARVDLIGGNFENNQGGTEFIHVGSGARLTVSGSVRFTKGVGLDVYPFKVDGSLSFNGEPPVFSSLTVAAVLQSGSVAIVTGPKFRRATNTTTPEILVEHWTGMTYPLTPTPVVAENAIPAAASHLRGQELIAMTRDGVSNVPDRLLGFSKLVVSGTTYYQARDRTGDLFGTVTPEGNVPAPPGTRYVWTNGTAGNVFWRKETGNGTTGWSNAVGPAGPVGPAGSRRDIALAAAGILAENFGIELLSSTGTAPTPGTIYGGEIGLFAGDVVTTLRTMMGNAAAAGTPPTLMRLGLADSTGTIVAVTADVKADAAWTTVNTIAGFALTTPYTVPADGGYYIVLLQVGTWGTTNPLIARSAALGASAYSAKIPGFMARVASFGTGKTDLPAVGVALAAAGGNNLTYWLAAS
jgi:hypothetical protein